MNEKNKLTNNIRYKKNGGITLIALVITIIVMLILAAISINIALNGGLFEYAGKAAVDTQNAIDKEQEYTNLATGMTLDQLIAKYTNEGEDTGTEGSLTTATLTTGTEVYITGVSSEHFYVIETSNSSTSTVKLLAKYNVKTNATPYAQNSSANTVRFDDDSSTYSGSEIEALVNDYVSGNGTSGGSTNCKLNLTLGSGEEARLLLKSEIDALNGGNDTSSSYGSNFPAWAKDRNYWLGSASGSGNVWSVVSSFNYLNNISYNITRSYGVRPVLVVSKSRLSLANQ